MAIKCIEDLHHFLNDEQNSSRETRIGDKARHALRDMLQHPGLAAVDSISSLAKRNGVDPSTLTRLGKRLGFSGFSELQLVFRRHVAETQPFYSGRVQERLESIENITSMESVRYHAQSECQKLLSASESLDPSALNRAVEMLVSAEHVYVLALRATYAFGYFFGSYLGTLRDDVTILAGPGSPLTADLDRLTKRDVLVAISFRPYTRSLVTAVDVIKEMGIPILAITDKESALETSDTEGVTLALDEPFYFDSATAQFFIIQTLLLTSAKRLGPSAVEKAKRRERIDKALNIEIH
ncbi:MurR/RpiR family transcriptional regulator [Pusillimonas sp. ANT_WB101]|uniref:MurR/RpiR family transcriptional regulator n=1 Tax=Pusillimonas sp. ANT_WB101 TaxID=2597356 RepID=UPI00165D66CF|nr:MurR/RpiR family transcriptional regulator [Pusillimonas sp. ANT_WB101]